MAMHRYHRPIHLTELTWLTDAALSDSPLRDHENLAMHLLAVHDPLMRSAGLKRRGPPKAEQSCQIWPLGECRAEAIFHMMGTHRPYAFTVKVDGTLAMALPLLEHSRFLLGWTTQTELQPRPTEVAYLLVTPPRALQLATTSL